MVKEANFRKDDFCYLHCEKVDFKLRIFRNLKDPPNLTKFVFECGKIWLRTLRFCEVKYLSTQRGRTVFQIKKKNKNAAFSSFSVS